MKQRIITGAVLTAIMITLFLLSWTFMYPVIIGGLCIIATWEMLGCIRQRWNLFFSIPAMVMSLISPIMVYYFGYGVMLPIAVTYLVLLFAGTVFFDTKIKIADISVLYLTTMYTVLCFTALLSLRYIGIGQSYVYILVFVAAWVTDTFAYFTGYFFGRHKLIPRISPKKTVEGAIGGIVFCTIAFLIYGLIVNLATDTGINVIILLLIAGPMSVLSQVGDLIASSIKRTYGIKDYSNLFPGHGGVLDRFDSIMILSPFLLFVAASINLFA